MADATPAEGFLRRWARLKSTGASEPVAPPPVEAPATPAPPTLADVAQLGADADFSRFVAPGVDGTVRRLALKKLFADPHFHTPDGLDIYMGDYTKADPIPAAMMAALHHARNVFGAGTQQDDDPAATSRPDPADADKTDPAEPAGTDPATHAPQDDADTGTHTPRDDAIPDPATPSNPDDITV
ncbi:DUF3306 domain-containing protein [Pseudoduganella chitinolytica]|uniref:DUF3306 domain-containing protein n=1 Tax=Pseudoduganella chitinolytica TaxID=34070 RepID=A0ABY8BHB7_9BURK|nr:DUF3306 domain-containing protein [Pseudoduganella chitinolytica]WEF35322.1 DUF3306 domain-containing protein [Pseudoduganella chitinolytica]